MAKKIIENKKKIAFVASGGAVKAACFHIGVLLAMQRFGFSFLGGLKKDEPRESVPGQVSIYVGSSAGSFITSLMAGGYTPEQLANALSKSNKNDVLRPIGYGDIIGSNFFGNISTTINSLLRIKKSKSLSIEGVIQTLLGINGLFTTTNVGKYLKNVMPSEDFSDLMAELYIVATELDNPNRIIFGPRELKASSPGTYETSVRISDAAIGSMSLPFIFGPYKLKIRDKEVYVFDGEIRKTLSSHVAKDAGADLIISSYTHQPYHYNPEYGSLMNYGLTSILIQTIYQLIENKIRAFRAKNELKENILEEVKNFFIEKKLPKELMNELVGKLEEKMNFNPNLDYIYIAPKTTDSRMFFEDHFNLSAESMTNIIRSGFKSAYQTLSQYQFDFSNSDIEIQLLEKDNLLA